MKYKKNHSIMTALLLLVLSIASFQAKAYLCWIDSGQVDEYGYPIYIQDDCPDGPPDNPNPNPPITIPDQPGAMTYTTHRILKIQWGNSNYPNYELYQSKNNGPWTLIYDGNENSYQLIDLEPGTYSFSVLAKNSLGKSVLTFGSTFVVN